MTIPYRYSDEGDEAFAIRRELERERWRASRLPFGREDGGVAVTTAKNSQTITGITTADGGNIVRVKRVQVKLCVPKGAWYTGWFGFIRLATGQSLSTGMDFANPAVLRPVHFLSNPDHATYWDAYLPAINLAEGGSLSILVHNDSVSLGALGGFMYWRYVVERGIGG